MSNTIFLPTPPEELAPATPPQPYTPEFLDGLTEEQRRSPELKEFWNRMHNSGAEHVSWLFWRYESKVLNTSLFPAQGSIFFLDCGRGPFAVTADHVYEGFLEDRDAYRVRSCQIGNVAFNPEERLIARGKNLGIDIATFEVTPEEIAATGKRVIKGIDGPWPPPPQPKEIVFFGGFPGNERDVINRNEVVFGLHSAMPGLTSFTDRQLCCQLDRSSWIDVRGLGLPPVGYELGGVSGGPMLKPIFVDSAWTWRLVGVVSEAKSIEGFERVTAERAHFILPSGKLSLW
jgi:hypothetical protein